MNSIRFMGKHIYPSKIVCVGRNYLAHVNELANEIAEQPVIFIKPNSSIASELHADKSNVIHYEGEICLLIMAGEIAGIGFGLDLTKRQVQAELKFRGLPWERAKAFDRSALFSDFVAYRGNFHALRMELYINDRLVQQGAYELMLHKPESILAEVKGFLSLEDGDVIMTGTPAGVGPLVVGDEYVGKIYANTQLLVAAGWRVK